MGALTVSMFMTLDGVVQAPGQPDEDPSGGFPHGGWQAPFFDDEWGKHVMEGIGRMDAMLLGRKTYDIFARHWPEQPADDPIATRFNAMPKYVASRTRTDLDWNNASVMEGDLADAVGRIKQKHAVVQTFGSADLAQSLMRLGVVDRFVLYLHPIVLGSGKRLFPEGIDPTRFRPLESRAFANGVVVLDCEPAGSPKYGSMASEQGRPAQGGTAAGAGRTAR